MDLPGIIETQLDGGGGSKRAVDLVTRYMSDEKFIILAAVPPNYDPEVQKLFTYLNMYDPKGVRTLGVITKPNLIARNGENEKQLMRLTKNERYPLQHHWHAVRSRSFGTREQTDTERDETERKLFASGIWASFPPNNVGITALRSKLSMVLLEHITNELPSLIKAVQEAIISTQESLKNSGKFA